jgi:hypothetical protein
VLWRLEMKLRKAATLRWYTEAKEMVDYRVAGEGARSTQALHTWLALVEQANSLEGYRTDNFQALGTEFVDGIIGGVMEHVVVAVIEVD